MTGIKKGVKALSVFIGLPLTCFLFGETIFKTPSVADCSFHSDPERYLGAEARVRKGVNDRVVAMARVLKRTPEGLFLEIIGTTLSQPPYRDLYRAFLAGRESRH